MTQESEFKFQMEPQSRRAGYPLLRFEGELKVATPQTFKNEDQPDSKERVVVKFDFIDINVIDTEELYAFPTASISIPYSTGANTIWMEGIGKTFRNLIPASEYVGMNMPFKVLEGKRQEWAYLPAELRRPMVDENGEPIMEKGRQKWGNQEGEAWQIVSVQGYGGPSGGSNIHDLIVEFIDGKDDKEFMNWLFTDMSIKSIPGHSAAVAAQSERKLLPMLIDAGKLTQDANGIYHKVAE